ncbi:hypothetical protein [Parapedobacter sp.]|nr:hypothetical protein [Parapedobacter sp.]
MLDAIISKHEQPTPRLQRLESSPETYGHVRDPLILTWHNRFIHR